MMTVEELMKPRYKVIADYPYSDLGVDEILNLKLDACDRWFIEIEKTSFPKLLYKEDFQRYSNLFRKLEWWEERKDEDMPLYMESLEIYPDHHFVKVTKHYPYVGFFEGLKGGEYWESPYLYNYKPATEEEYNNYIKTTTPTI